MRYSEGDTVYLLHPDQVDERVDDHVGYPVAMQEDILAHLNDPLTVFRCTRSLSGHDVYLLAGPDGKLIGHNRSFNAHIVRRFLPSGNAWLFVDEMLDHTRSDGSLPV